MRMTRRVKPPTAAVTMTSTWPWSEAMSDAGGGGGNQGCSVEEEKMWKRRQRRRGSRGLWEKGEQKGESVRM